MSRKAYGQIKETTLDRFIKRLRHQKVFKHIPQGSYVVDIGCGYHGEFLTLISQRIKKGIGFDLKVSKKPKRQNIMLRRAKVDISIPAKNNSADVVTALAIIEHLDHPERFLKEIHRILKPNGMLLLTTPSKSSKALLEFLAFRLKVISQAEILDHKRYFNEQSLIDKLIKTGFEPQNIVTSTFEFGMNLFSKARK